MGFSSNASTSSVRSPPKATSKRNVADEKYEKHRRQQSEERQLFLVIVLVALSIYALWHFTGSPKAEVISKVQSMHETRLQQLRRNDLKTQMQNNEDGDPEFPLNHPGRDLHLGSLSKPQIGLPQQKDDRIQVDQELLQKNLDQKMVQHIDELKKFQEEFHEDEEESFKDIQEELERKAKGS
jgi:hypothetical protein